MDNLIVDVVVGLQAGDEGKGKVTHHLLESGGYTHCVRYNGGGNAGHTIYHNDKKFVTHHIPAGVFYGVKSVIGPGCVVNVNNFLQEIKYLNENGVDTEGLIYISRKAHVVQGSHLKEDSADKEIGTTKTGNGPCYRDKYGRKGVRAEQVPELEEYLVDFFAEMHYADNLVVALFEGAQGFQLDVDWGDYPYVTSSHCTVAGALLNGIPASAVRNVWGVAKAYETYVGNKDFQEDGDIFNKIQKVGKEYGATTGRVRQCNWLNLEFLNKAVLMNGVTHMVINKMDVLREVQAWEIRLNADEPDRVTFNSEASIKAYLEDFFPEVVIYFSDNPVTIAESPNVCYGQLDEQESLRVF